MIHLYAFVDGLDRLPARSGATGEALDTQTLDGITAVVGEVAEPLPQTPEGAVAHDVVVEALLEHAAAVLPARLGQPFADRAALVAATNGNVPALRRTLARVRGCVELGIRLSSDEALAPEPAADGTAYMRQLAAVQARRRVLADEVQATLRPLAVDSRVDERHDSATLFRAAYLVRRSDAAEVARRARRLAARHPELTAVCTGPWAPYSFAGEAAA
jgi:hypothetical protein